MAEYQPSHMSYHNHHHFDYIHGSDLEDMEKPITLHRLPPRSTKRRPVSQRSKSTASSSSGPDTPRSSDFHHHQFYELAGYAPQSPHSSAPSSRRSSVQPVSPTQQQQPGTRGFFHSNSHHKTFGKFGVLDVLRAPVHAVSRRELRLAIVAVEGIVLWFVIKWVVDSMGGAFPALLAVVVGFILKNVLES